MAGIWSWHGIVGAQTSQLERTVGMLDEQALRTFEIQDTVLTSLEIYVAGLSWQDIANDPHLFSFVQRLVAASPSVDTLGLVAPDGRIVLASESAPPLPQIILSDRDFVQAFPPGTGRRPTFVAGPVISRVDGRVQVHMSRPHMGDDGLSDGGVISSAFSPRLFERVFGDVAATRQTRVTLVRDDGLILARYPDEIRAEGERLPDGALALSLGRESEPAGSATHTTRTGSLLTGLHLAAARRVGSYPVVLQYELDPNLLRNEWLHEMAFPTIGAIAAMALLLLLTAKAQRRTFEERNHLLTRTQSAEAGHALAHERAELEARLRQTEKVAALGQLAAGVAHDFNNVLQAIVSSAAALKAPSIQPAEVSRIATTISAVSERGIDLTRRMLDYARRDERPLRSGDVLNLETRIDVAAALRNAVELLGRTLSSLYNVRLSIPQVQLPSIAGNQAELETVIINLVVNARDAMPGGGVITVAAAETMASGDTPLISQRCIRLTVLDTGMGMDAATLNRAGEAFFTTKRRGEGTGLGLSMARGYAERAGGSLQLESREGHGTIVTLWLPIAE